MAARRGQMTKKSKYFTAEFFGFFSDLAKNNNKEWFTKNKERYENAVQEPSLRFIRDAGPRLQKISPFLVAEAKPFGGSIPRLPGHPLLAGQEPVQDRGRDPFLAREGARAGGDGARLLSPHALGRDDGPFGRLASRRADIEEDPRSDCR